MNKITVPVVYRRTAIAKWNLARQRLVQNVQQYRVHAHHTKWRACPPLLHVNDNIQRRQHPKTPASHQRDETEGPEIFVDWYDTAPLFELA